MKVKMVEINSKAIIITINEKLLTQRKPKDWRHYYTMIREMISFHIEKNEIESAPVSVNYCHRTNHLKLSGLKQQWFITDMSMSHLGFS